METGWTGKPDDLPDPSGEFHDFDDAQIRPEVLAEVCAWWLFPADLDAGRAEVIEKPTWAELCVASAVCRRVSRILLDAVDAQQRRIEGYLGYSPQAPDYPPDA